MSPMIWGATCAGLRLLAFVGILFCKTIGSQVSPFVSVQRMHKWALVVHKKTQAII